ncbi:MAG: SRPBCC family protein [Psychrobium sp.]|nr:SRPBCC family protein [Psychrobium sp.]
MKIIRVLFWLFIILFLAGIFLPQNYQVDRTIIINSSLSDVHKLTNDLTQWPRWSPWSELEPSVEVTIGNVKQGVGANQAWTDDSGGGHLLFIASSENKNITYNIWFSDSENPALASISYKQLTANKIQVDWHIEGDIKIPVIGFYLALMMDMFIGPAFELGLDNLKIEATPTALTQP